MQNLANRAGATIKDVAFMAGVSIATVSRVLNNPESVSPEKKEQVLKAVEKLNYVPNPVARALGTNKKGSIAIVVPNIINSCMAEIVRGALELLEQNFLDALLFNSNENTSREKDYCQLLRNKMVEGAIFISGCGEDLDLGALSSIMPVALIDSFDASPGIDSFIVDEQLGMLRLITHLMELGHREIGLLAGNFKTGGAIRRLGAFKKAMETEGLCWKNEYIVPSEWTMEGGYNALIKLFKRRNKPTAVVSSSDIVALGALGAAYEMNLRVPGDLSIVGFDNFPESKFSVPPLTTLNYPHFRLGQMAAKAIVNRLKNSKVENLKKVLPLELLKRSSSGQF